MLRVVHRGGARRYSKRVAIPRQAKGWQCLSHRKNSLNSVQTSRRKIKYIAEAVFRFDTTLRAKPIYVIRRSVDIFIMFNDENRDPQSSVLGRRQRENALQLGPRKKPWVIIDSWDRPSYQSRIALKGASVIRSYIAGGTLAELYTHYVASTR